MTAKEFKDVVNHANAKDDFSEVDDSILHGCGLPGFRPVIATKDQVAKFIRWQALRLGGDWDTTELTDIKNLLSRRVTIIP